MKWLIFQVGIIFGVLCTCMSTQLKGQDMNYKSQSLFIYKFSRHISWPSTDGKEPFVIGIYGNSPIFEELQIMASLKKAANGRKIEIRRISSLSDMGGEHIIYLSSSRSRELRTLLSKVQGKPVLLITERDGLAKKGACINFMIMENETLKFEVNKAVLRAQKLEIAPELLRLGFEVG